jgi:hypothetical protein
MTKTNQKRGIRVAGQNVQLFEGKTPIVSEQIVTHAASNHKKDKKGCLKNKGGDT